MTEEVIVCQSPEREETSEGPLGSEPLHLGRTPKEYSATNFPLNRKNLTAMAVGHFFSGNGAI